MEFSDILASLRRRWRIGVGIFLISLAILGAFYITRKETEPTPRFSAQVNVLVPARDKDGNFPDGVPRTLFFGQAELASGTEVKQQALANADIPTDQVNSYSFAFAQNEIADLISLTVTGPTPEETGEAARGWADAFLDARAERSEESATDLRNRSYRGIQVSTLRLQQIEQELASIDPLLLTLNPGVGSPDGGPPQLNVPANTPIDAALLVYERSAVVGRIDGARQQYVDNKAIAENPSSEGSVVQVSAVQNITPATSSPQTPTMLILGLGIVLALLVPVLIDRMDHTIRDAKTAASAFAAPVLSSIPGTSRSRRDEIARPGTAREAAFRALAATSVATDRLPRSIVVTSALGEEQDAVAANFAAALAGLGVKVALVGTSPRQAWFARGSEVAGNGHEATNFPQMMELAYNGRLNGEAPRLLSGTAVDGLFVLPPGENDIDVATDGLAPMLQALDTANIDVTVIAAPAMLKDPNTTIYAWTTRSVLWVMETGEITVEIARDAANRLTLAGVTPFGVAMVDQEP